MIRQGRHDLAEAIAVRGNARRLGQEETGGGQVTGDHRIQVDQERSQREANRKGNQSLGAENCQARQERVPVESPDDFTQRINAIGEGEQRMQEPEEGGQHLDRIQTGRSGNLHDHDDDAQTLADVLEARGEHVDDRDKHERNSDRRPHETQSGDRLNADDQVADRHDERLNDPEEREQHPPTHVLGGRRGRADALFIHVKLEEEDKRKRADPQGQVREQRGHRRAVGGHGVHGLRLNLRRRGHEGGDRLGVDPQRIREVTQCVRGGQRRNIRGHRVEVGLDGANVRGARLGRRLSPVQEGIELVEQARHLVALTAQRIQRATHR